MRALPPIGARHGSLEPGGNVGPTCASQRARTRQNTGIDDQAALMSPASCAGAGLCCLQLVVLSLTRGEYHLQMILVDATLRLKVASKFGLLDAKGRDAIFRLRTVTCHTRLLQQLRRWTLGLEWSRGWRSSHRC
jgi:hypothetical protein